MADDAGKRFIIEPGSVRPLGKVKQAVDHTSDEDKKAKAEADRALSDDDAD